MSARAGVAARWIVHVLAPLVAGCAVYLVLRPIAPAAALRDALGLDALTDALAQAESQGGVAGALLRWIDGQLPDAAWAYAFTASAWLVWDRGPRRQRLAWTLLAMVIATGWELGQLVGLVPGGFSLADLVSTVGACALAFWMISSTTPPARILSDRREDAPTESKPPHLSLPRGDTPCEMS